MRHLIHTLSLLALLGLNLHASADDLAAKIDAFVRQEMQAQRIPGLSLLVNKDGATTLAKGYGLANVEHQVPVQPHTIFQSGSVGKQFTATAIMMLVEEGKLALDDPIQKYLTNAPPTWVPIRIRHLLTHTSGLGDYPAGFDFRRDYTEEELLAHFMKTPPAFTPGDKWAYSNIGYMTLGAIIRQVTGQFYGDFLKTRIFQPLGMDTARVISEADIVPHRAAGYRLFKGELKNQEWVSSALNTTADGALYLNVLDLAKWDTALAAGQLLQKTSFDQMWTPVTLNDGKTHTYGFGWFIVQVKGHRLIHHGGAWQGFQTAIQRYVDDQLTVIVLANLASANVERLARAVASLHLPALTPDWMKTAPASTPAPNQ